MGIGPHVPNLDWGQAVVNCAQEDSRPGCLLGLGPSKPEVLIVASDGVWEFLSNEKVLEEVRASVH